MRVDHCGTGNSPSPIIGREVYDDDAGVARSIVTFRCHDCGEVLGTEERERVLVRRRGLSSWRDDGFRGER